MLLSHIKSPVHIYFPTLRFQLPPPSHLNYTTLTSKNHQQIVNIHTYPQPKSAPKLSKNQYFSSKFPTTPSSGFNPKNRLETL